MRHNPPAPRVAPLLAAYGTCRLRRRTARALARAHGALNIIAPLAGQVNTVENARKSLLEVAEKLAVIETAAGREGGGVPEAYPPGVLRSMPPG